MKKSFGILFLKNLIEKLGFYFRTVSSMYYFIRVVFFEFIGVFILFV